MSQPTVENLKNLPSSDLIKITKEHVDVEEYIKALPYDYEVRLFAWDLIGEIMEKEGIKRILLGNNQTSKITKLNLGFKFKTFGPLGDVIVCQKNGCTNVVKSLELGMEQTCLMILDNIGAMYRLLHLDWKMTNYDLAIKFITTQIKNNPMFDIDVYKPLETKYLYRYDWLLEHGLSEIIGMENQGLVLGYSINGYDEGCQLLFKTKDQPEPDKIVLIRIPTLGYVFRHAELYDEKSLKEFTVLHSLATARNAFTFDSVDKNFIFFKATSLQAYKTFFFDMVGVKLSELPNRISMLLGSFMGSSTGLKHLDVQIGKTDIYCKVTVMPKLKEEKVND